MNSSPAVRVGARIWDATGREPSDLYRGARLVAGLVAVSQRNHADAARSASVEQRDRARIARLFAESERELDSHLDLAFLLAAEAWRREDSPATRGALLTALTHNATSERERLGSAPDHGGTIHRTHSSFAGFLTGPPRAQLDVDVSADGRIVASAGTAKLDGTGGLVLSFERARVGRSAGSTARLRSTPST
jgi:hypothetical protein